MTRRILVVDDSRTQLERLRLLLEQAGYQVQTAADGQEGVRRVESSQPDLIVSDVVMPRMDGFAFCRAVRDNPITRRTPFILVTEKAAPEDIVKGLEAGADNFIPKPYDEDELLARIKRILEQLELRGHDYLGVEVRLQVGNRELCVTADKQQIMELLFSAMESLGTRTDDLIRANRELERAAAEAEKREAAVLQARDEAERANRAKDEFLSRMSHELRTPLNAILGFSQVLETGDLTLDHRESVEQITKAGRHLLGLIDEILDISRIASGHLSLSPEPVAVAQVVNETVGLIQSLATKHRIECRVEEPDGSHILADRQRLKQVLLNLLSNAIKYNREGGKVTVSWARGPDGPDGPDGMLHIMVADTGPGIPREQMERLFSEFDRLGAEQTDVEGTGLGLCLSRRLVQAMGGTITVKSEVGAGSVFTVELPLAEPPIRRQAHEVEEHPPQHGSAAGPRTVLYIEDNLSNLKLIERIFRDRPEIRLLSAVQGRAGLELAREHQPDLILLDAHLPDVPGTEVLRCLREDPATRRIPVLALSGDATESQINKVLAAGAHGYLAKPFDLRAFLDTVEEVLWARANPRSN